MAVSLGGLALTGGMALFNFARSYSILFLGKPRTTKSRQTEEFPLKAYLPQILILVMMLLLCLFPRSVFQLCFLTLNSLFPGLEAEFLLRSFRFNTILSQIGLISAGFLVFTLLIVYLKNRIKINPNAPVWGCGYQGNTGKMQYTGKAFSKSVSKMLSFAVPENKKYKETGPAEVFPVHRSYTSWHPDLIETRAIGKLTRQILSVLNAFQFIQNGNLQRYILYGLVFIMLVFAITLFNLI